MSKMEKISFVIPCYYSEKYISSTVEELQNAIKKDFNNYSTEIILVNDGSKDGTFKNIEKTLEKYSNIKAIDFTKNFGQHNAIMAGLNIATGDIIMCLDDDGQTPADEAKKLIDALDENTDVVYAEYKFKKHSWFRNFGSKLNGKMAEIVLKRPKEIYISSFFVMKAVIKDEIIKYKNAYPYLEGLVLRATDKIKNVLVNHKERENGTSGYTLRKLLRLWLNGFTNFSVKPLRISIIISSLFVITAVFTSIGLIINRILDPGVPMGWTSMIIIILIVGAAICFILGIIGEYVGRIYLSLNNNPQYVVRKVILKDKEE